MLTKHQWFDIEHPTDSSEAACWVSHRSFWDLKRLGTFHERQSSRKLLPNKDKGLFFKKNPFIYTDVGDCWKEWDHRSHQIIGDRSSVIDPGSPGSIQDSLARSCRSSSRMAKRFWICRCLRRDGRPSPRAETETKFSVEISGEIFRWWAKLTSCCSWVSVSSIAFSGEKRRRSPWDHLRSWGGAKAAGHEKHSISCEVFLLADGRVTSISQAYQKRES